MPDRKKAELVAEITADANKVRDEITGAVHKLQEQIDEIVLAAAKKKRQLTDDEKAKRKDLRDKQKRLQKGFKELAFATVMRLDASTDLQEIKGKLDSINEGLSGDLKRLKNIKRYAETAARIADLLAKLAEKGADLLL